MFLSFKNVQSFLLTLLKQGGMQYRFNSLKGKLLPLKFLYYEKIANLMYDINTNFAPMKISNLFSKITSVHSYSSSTSEHFFFIKQSALAVQSKPFLRVVFQSGNYGISTSLKKLPRNSFERL